MLRLWERERLITPQRTSGGHRLYSSNDVQRLRPIAHLRQVERLTSAAIRRELGVSENSVSSEMTGPESSLGSRLRALRTERGWSLARVAQKSGLSVSFLSAVERGQSSISVGSLFKLADAYGTTVPGLSPGYRPDQRSLLHPQDRPRYGAGRGLVIIEDLVTRPGALEAQWIEIQPGGGSEEAYYHPGEELIYVLSGQLVFWIDERDRYALETGDSLFFRSMQLHRWRNDSDTPTTVVWINVPIIDASAAGADGRHGDRQRALQRGSPQDSHIASEPDLATPVVPTFGLGNDVQVFDQPTSIERGASRRPPSPGGVVR
jgi:transcriptional regulator with XRE-family HTH domain